MNNTKRQTHFSLPWNWLNTREQNRKKKFKWIPLYLLVFNVMENVKFDVVRKTFIDQHFKIDRGKRGKEKTPSPSPIAYAKWKQNKCE